ncbi:hypothetical protein DY124_05715 [Apilactobacillus micheneri]|uniref:lectin-like domain-containing protein n=1 Tax=Apilactobacillus micheneri TaxID=1899430 RepID=UPI001129F2D1|nr:DUF5776 domain-containing protein [Apilactobacillus micheneri]TPR43380.1 hypothetical protein DY124_05715 [Apilactobacillus micheneri]TPR47473.1 hypothetical protein DY125_05715 [Apilactobacillus micheneri]
MKKITIIYSCIACFFCFNYFSVNASDTNVVNNIEDAFDVSNVEKDGNTVVLTNNGSYGEVRGAATLKNKIDFSKGFELKGKVNIGNLNYINSLGDGISFGFSNDNTKSIGRAGGGLGISGLNGAFGWKLDTFYNTTSSNYGSNDDEILQNHFYDSDPKNTIINPDKVYTPGSIYGAFVSNDYNNGINTTRTYDTTANNFSFVNDNNEYLSLPKSINYVNSIDRIINNKDNIDIDIHYDGEYISVKLGNVANPQWKMKVSDLNKSFSNKQPKSFFIAGSNGLSTGTQKFTFDSISYSSYPTIDLSFKDNNNNYIYNNQVNNKNDYIGSSIDNSIKYSTPVSYDYDGSKHIYKFNLPNIRGYHFNKIESDHEENLPKSDDQIHYTGNVYGNKNNGNVSTIYIPNRVNFKYVDEDGNPIKDKNGQTNSGNLSNVISENGKTFYSSFKHDYSSDLKNKFDFYTLDENTNNLNIDFSDNSKFKDGIMNIEVHYKKMKSANDKGNTSNKDKSYYNHGIIKNKTIVYPIKSMNLYKNNHFIKNNLLVHYTNKPMINKPIFVVDGYGKSRTGLLRYRVHEMNHKSIHGYITVRKDYVLPVYETRVRKFVTVINPGGINRYTKKDLTGKISHYRQGSIIKVRKIVWNRRSTRYVLNDGSFITANKTLTSLGAHKMHKYFIAKKGLNVYGDVQFNTKLYKMDKKKIVSIKNWEYSDKEIPFKRGSLRYRIFNGYVYANSKYLKLISGK